MKVNLVGKYKWYLMGIIIAVLIMSIGLSFCTWDTTSLDIYGKMNGGTADFRNLPTWSAKVVGEDFTDANGLMWLVVDKKPVTDQSDPDYGKTNMVLMTYYVTEQMVYDSTLSNPDYNRPENPIRKHLNDTWYPTIDAEIRKYVEPKVTAYLPGTKFWGYNSGNPGKPTIEVLAPSTSNRAWLAGENEVGLILTQWATAPQYIHDAKFEYFTQSYAKYTTNIVNSGDDITRIAQTKAGIAVYWWTRTGKLTHVATTISVDGGATSDNNALANANNWLRPCVQVRF